MPLFADNVRNLYASLVVVALVIAALVLGQDILIPLAVATLIAFILNPIVRRLMNWRVPEGLAVSLVLMGVIAATVMMSTVLTTQMLSLAAELQTYKQNLVEKVRYVSAFGKGEGAIKRATDAVENLGAAIENEFRPVAGTPPTTSPQPGAAPSKPVVGPAVVPNSGKQIADTEDGSLSALKILGAPLAKTALTLLFTLFLLLQHQDLRDRIVRVAGTDNLSGTTAAMDDAGTRLSRLFLAQAMLNVGFGVFVGIALAVIGVPNPILWGVLTAIMRFVPFIGSFIAAVPPIILAAAVDPGWGMAIATLVLFAVGEPVMGHMVEPLVLGKRAGLSPFAMVVSASFWTLIWGPLGLILAAPLTMLLVVLGRYISGLEVVSVLLGDERALTPDQELYGRILAGDEPEAVAQITEAVSATSIVDVNDKIVLPALQIAAFDIRRGKLDADRVNLAQDAMREVIEFMTDVVNEAASKRTTEPGERPTALIVPARGQIDALAAEIVAVSLKSSSGVATSVVTGSAGLSALANERDITRTKPFDAVVIATVGGMDPRHLAIMMRRAERDFPSARVSALDYGGTTIIPGSSPSAEKLARFDSLVKLAASLNFTPTRSTEEIERPGPNLKAALAS